MTGRRPLEGIKLVEIAFGGAAPLATKLLADYGVDVVKIEARNRPDFTRTAPPFANGQPGLDRTSYFTNRNSSKRSVELDLKIPAYAAVARDLVAQADVVLSNFRPGVLDQYDLDYESVSKTNPNVIYMSVPMRGAGSPGSSDRGVGRSVSALTGLLALTGYSEVDVLGPGTHFPDHSSNPGHTLTVIMSALIRRRREGKGCFIEVSQVPSTLQVLGPQVLDYAVTGRSALASGNFDEGAAPYGAFPVGDKDAWLALSIRTDDQWRTFCQMAGRPELASDDRFSDASARLENRDDANKVVIDWLASLVVQDETSSYWPKPAELAEKLQAIGVPAAPCEDARELVEDDPFVRETHRLVTIPHPAMGEATYNVPPYRYADGSEPILRSAPIMGQHTDVVLDEWLGRTLSSYES